MSRANKSNPTARAFFIKGASVPLETRVLIVNQVKKAMRDRITASGKLRNAPERVAAKDTATGSGRVAFAPVGKSATRQSE